MRFFTTFYLLLLAYIIAALAFWWISLGKQSGIIFQQEIATLRQTLDSNKTPFKYNQKLSEIEKRKSLRTSQYLGEGATFLFVILIGASVVYSSFRRSIRLSRQQNNFMLSVTHELKSPIAAMKLSLQTMQKHRLDEEKQQQLLGRCVAEANRLNDLCENLLIASQMEGKQYKSNIELTDLTKVVKEIAAVYENRYPGRFAVDIASDVSIWTDVWLLQICLNNLVENALKYGGSTGESVSISLFRKERKVLLQVADHGPGIPDNEKKKIFDKFYRIGNEETRRTKGTGMGLYLTCSIVKQLKGSIAVKDNKPAGSIFEIALPA